MIKVHYGLLSIGEGKIIKLHATSQVARESCSINTSVIHAIDQVYHMQ